MICNDYNYMIMTPFDDQVIFEGCVLFFLFHIPHIGWGRFVRSVGMYGLFTRRNPGRLSEHGRLRMPIVSSRFFPQNSCS